MAQVYPQHIPQQERDANPHKRAEYLVYDALSRQLGDEWMVLYGTAIKWRHKYGVSDREEDFIVAHPDLGILALEVKGGSISCEGGVWFTTPLHELHKPRYAQRRHQLSRSPYDQVTDAAEAYRRKIKDYIRAQHLNPWEFKIATAVCFPDIEIPSSFYLASNALREITLDRTDLCNLQERLYQIFRLYQGQSGRPPGNTGLEILKQVFARNWHIDSFLSYQLQSAEERRKELTEEQFHLLYDLEGNPKLLIAGCAGSGKTMIAVEKARRLAEQGQRVLLTCYNENLAEWLRQSDFVRPSMMVAHFHGLCYQMSSSSAKAKLPRWSEKLGVDRETYFKKLMPEALELAAREVGVTFDAIIVDEGQDFEVSWYNTLRQLLTSKEDGVFYIFYDDNQRIYTDSRIPFKKWPSYRLTKNMRNTNPIFQHVKCFYHRPNEIRPSGLSGPDPWFVDPSPYPNEYSAVQDVLRHLSQQHIVLSQIVVLTPRAKENSVFGGNGQRGDFPLVWTTNPSVKQVRCCTIQAFKGLESSVIILGELRNVPPNKMNELMYVGMSRAKDYLIVLGNVPANGR